MNRIFIILILLLSVIHAKSQEVTLTAIANKDGSPPAIKFAELKSILMGEKQRWHNGTKITIALMKTNTTPGKSTCKKVYDMSGDELNKFWLALVFQGKAEAPVFFSTSSDLENFVAQNRGAIGIMEQSPTIADVKVVAIDGQKSF